MDWIQKTYDMVSKSRKMYKIYGEVIDFIENNMKNQESNW